MPRRLSDPEAGKVAAEQALEQAAPADELGFDFVSVSEHHYQAGMCNPNTAVLAAALTAVVHRAKLALLGPLVSMNNPVRVAEEIAMLDQLAQETRARTEEAMLLIKKALSEPEPFSWKGEHHDFPVVSVWPGATQLPHRGTGQRGRPRHRQQGRQGPGRLRLPPVRRRPGHAGGAVPRLPRTDGRRNPRSGVQRRALHPRRDTAADPSVRRESTAPDPVPAPHRTTSAGAPSADPSSSSAPTRRRS
ncbi:LLM class flavin-dependent oxidoreductase [Streptomyces sp. BH105]|uniref:LLM class flavin-dependent oxidoreductase n=1 Tax=Streptomyces sp. BH105 TaxID=3410408 RepID=UPI003CED414F